MNVDFEIGKNRSTADLVLVTKALLQIPEVVAGLDGDLAKSIPWPDAGPEAIEAMAALSHEQWSGWARWMIDHWDDEHKARWERQIRTEYANLSEKEKQSDRDEAMKVLRLLRRKGFAIVHAAASIAKAIKPGSRTTGGLTGAPLGLVQHAANQQMPQVQADFRERIHDHVDDWQEAVKRHKRDHRKYPLIADQELKEARSKILRRAQRDIRVAYETLFELGKRKAGNLKPIGRDEKHVLEKLRRDEFLYLRNFMDDIQQGKGKMDYDKRADMYGNAAIESAWAGVVAADLSHNRLLKWATSGGENTCDDCLRLAAGGRWGDGVYSGNELIRIGVFPGSGKLACTTHCKCSLRAIPKRAWKPSGKVVPFQTVRKKPDIRDHYERQKTRHTLRWRGRAQHAKRPTT